MLIMLENETEEFKALADKVTKEFSANEIVENLDTYIKEAINDGVVRFLCVGYDVESSKKAIEIAEKYEFRKKMAKPPLFFQNAFI